jgi:hypothetical protein
MTVRSAAPSRSSLNGFTGRAAGCLFAEVGYQQVWRKLTSGLSGLVTSPAARAPECCCWPTATTPPPT